MTDAPTPTPLRLLPGHSLRLRRRQPLRLRALQGTLWITVDGLPDDFVLQPGDCRVFAAGSKLLVTAMDGSAVLTAAPLQAAPAWRERFAAIFGRLANVVGA